MGKQSTQDLHQSKDKKDQLEDAGSVPKTSSRALTLLSTHLGVGLKAHHSQANTTGQILHQHNTGTLQHWIRTRLPGSGKQHTARESQKARLDKYGKEEDQKVTKATERQQREDTY